MTEALIIAGFLLVAALVLYGAGAVGGTWRLNREHRERDPLGGAADPEPQFAPWAFGQEPIPGDHKAPPPILTDEELRQLFEGLMTPTD